MNNRKTSLFVIAAFSIVMVSNSFAQGYSLRRDRSHDRARLHETTRAFERLQTIENTRVEKDYVVSSESQLIVTTQTPDSIAPIVITQIDDVMIIWSSLTLESFDVEPGVHEIVVAPRSDPTNGQMVTIDVEPGVRYYIGWHESEPAIWWEESN
ncbi:MAG: hypothetical protein O6946_06655 [Gammaproteobacteria bacterium]|nr:hypothetical protein [Gammaproteobacteria bacterium]MCZ6716728.1 hypothetical protein [Gammaproteobacteria bacterium]